MKNQATTQQTVQETPSEAVSQELETLTETQQQAQEEEPDVIDDWIDGLGKKPAENQPEQAQEEEESEEEQEEEEEEQEEQETPVFAIEIDGVKLEGEEAITSHITELQTKAKDLETAVAEYQANEAKLVEIVEMVPEFETLIKRLAKGDSLRTALIHAGFGPEDFEVASEDEPDAEAVVQAKLERKRQIAEAKKAQKEFEENSAKSEAMITEIQTEFGFDDKVKDQLIGNMAQFIQDSMKGKLNKEVVGLFLKGINFDSAVKKAQKQGEIMGKNEKITIERKKRDASGVPSFTSGLANTPPRVKYDDPMTEMLDQAAKRR